VQSARDRKGDSMSNWPDTSIMFSRGLAKGKAGTTHRLTEAMQGVFHYTMGPYSQPVLHIKSGDRVTLPYRPHIGT
jgi:hypothetical protein